MKNLQQFMVMFVLIGAFICPTKTIAGTAEVDSANYLIQQREVVQIFETINLEHIRSLKSCLCQVDNKSIGNEKCQKFPSKTNLYTQKYLTVEGVLSERTFQCSDMLEGYLYGRVKRNYNIAKKALGLSAPLQRSPYRYARNFSETIPGDQRLKINTSGIHPDIMNSASLDSMLKKLSSYSAEEIKDLLGEYDDLSQNLCRQFFSENTNLKNSDSLINEFSKENICKILLTNSQDWDMASMKHESYLNLIALQKNYFNWAVKYRREFRDEQERKYLEAINKTPIILLVSNDSPSNIELFDALSIIESNATKRRSMILEEEKDKDLVRSISQLQSGDISPRKLDELNEKLLSYSDFSYAKDISLALLSNKGIDVDREVVNNLEKKLQKIKRNDALLEGGLLLAANIACFLPAGKLVGVARQVFFRSGCMLIMGLPVNLYFMGSSLIEYNKTLVKFLATTEGKYYWSKIEKLGDERTNVFLSTILLPLGASAGDYKVFIKSLKK